VQPTDHCVRSVFVSTGTRAVKGESMEIQSVTKGFTSVTKGFTSVTKGF
jgi:hypothetical protein